MIRVETQKQPYKLPEIRRREACETSLWLTSNSTGRGRGLLFIRSVTSSRLGSYYIQLYCACTSISRQAPPAGSGFTDKLRARAGRRSHWLTFEVRPALSRPTLAFDHCTGDPPPALHLHNAASLAPPRPRSSSSFRRHLSVSIQLQPLFAIGLLTSKLRIISIKIRQLD